MGNLLRELNGVLLKQIRLYGRFITLLKKQWTCTTDYSLDPLLEINAKKEIMVDDIQRLEKKRSLLMLSIERQLGMAPGLTLKTLIQSQKDPINSSLSQNRKKITGANCSGEPIARTCSQINGFFFPLAQKIDGFYSFYQRCGSLSIHGQWPGG